jgi:hypothetical protein
MAIRTGGSKEKSEAIGATKPAHLDSIKIAFESDGSISFGDDMEDAYVETSYERTKGPKIVNRINLPEAQYESDVWHFLRKNYDKTFAVDTNSAVIGGRSIAITSVVELRQDFIGSPRGVERYFRFFQPFCIEIRDPKAVPEKLGWLLAFDQLRHQGRWSELDRTAMIVDHDLSNHALYNNWTAPLVQNYFLPERARLHYASSDTGRDHPFNKALAVADSLSSRTTNAIKSGEVAMHISTKPSHSQYDAIRVVHFE